MNRGVPADYEELANAGISVKGKIVIAKYGGSWRGIKPKLAGETISLDVDPILVVSGVRMAESQMHTHQRATPAAPGQTPPTGDGGL